VYSFTPIVSRPAPPVSAALESARSVDRATCDDDCSDLPCTVCEHRTPDRAHERSPRGHRRSARRPPPVDDEAYSTQTQQTARSNRTVCWLLDRRRRTRAGTRDRRRRGRLSRTPFESNRITIIIIIIKQKKIVVNWQTKHETLKTLPFRQFGHCERRVRESLHSTLHSPFDCASDRSVSRRTYLIVIRCSR
jgi:hypothetical protein